MRAFVEWQDDVKPALARRMRTSLRRCVRYLRAAQRGDGEWVPLWFGNQHTAGLENPTYGTAQVVIALRALHDGGVDDRTVPLLERRGMVWLAGVQGDDGGWGGGSGAPPSIEETALAVRALAGSDYHDAAVRGTEWLLARTRNGTAFASSPIGLYFAKLWYADRLYPLVFTVWALDAMSRSGGPTEGRSERSPRCS
jgi:squalene-hopene/tetraprenyl-beta-curcumene cyclase